ncbi:MAG: CoA transferase, partial [Proteobacteria bacterium]|nr:CoA transferase [Pseudomonadota bacterium]
VGATWRTLFTTFSDLAIENVDFLVDGDRVAVLGKISTTDRIGWFGLPPTGSPIVYRLVLLFTVMGDQIVHDERIYDSTGVMDRLGLGRAVMAEINPRLIYAASSGYGSTGPYRDYPAMDLTVQAMSGIMSITGFPDGQPVRAGATVCDFFGGVHLYGAVVTALLERERTGTVRAVEVAMLEASYFSLSSNLAALHAKGASPRVGNRQGSLSLAPYNIYPTADGYIAIITNHDAHWQALLTAFGQQALSDDPRLNSIKARVQHMELVDAMVSDWTRPLTKQAAFELLIRHRVPCAPVRDLAEVIADPHLHARGWLQEIDHPEFGRVTVPGSPLHFAGLEPPPHQPSARLGADSATVLRERLGLSDADIDTLRKDGVI